MASPTYTTKVVTVGDITVTVSKAKDATAGGRLKALLEFIAARVPVDPGYGVGSERPSHPIAPGGGGGKPDQGLPGDQPKPDQGLPGDQPGVDNTLPGAWLKEHADEIVKIVLNKCVDCRPEAGPK